jgi:hypothetical protein
MPQVVATRTIEEEEEKEEEAEECYEMKHTLIYLPQ